MRAILPSLLPLLILLWPAASPAQQVETLAGTAHNVSVGLRDSVTLQITRNADGSYGLTAGFGMVNLVGDVTATGYPPTFDDGYSACAEGHECILFGGTITLDERGGFDPGTETVFAMHLDLDSTTQTGTGVYHIGPLPGFNFQQYGTILLVMPVS